MRGSRFIAILISLAIGGPTWAAETSEGGIRLEPSDAVKEEEAAAKKEKEKASTEPEPGLITRIYQRTYKDMELFWGYSKPTVLEGGPAPSLMHWGVGLSAAYLFPKVTHLGSTFVPFAGAAADFRYIGQYSTLDAEVGNSRGLRLNPISPMVGMVLDRKYIFKAHLQIFGSYTLSNPTIEQEELTYSSPFGVKISAMYRLGDLVGLRRLFIGLQTEQLVFKQKEISGVGSVKLDPKLSFSEWGLTATYVF